jgi:hypothetical protein
MNQTTDSVKNDSVPKKRIFVFYEKAHSKYERPKILALPEDQIQIIESQAGSENVYLKVNGVEVQGSFENLIAILGEKVLFNS